MKKIFVLLVFISTGFSLRAQNVTVTGDMWFLDGHEVKISVRDDGFGMKEIASAQSSGNKFEIGCQVDKPTIGYFSYGDGGRKIVLEPGVIRIECEKMRQVTIRGTPYNDMIYGWQLSDEGRRLDDIEHDLNILVSSPDYQSLDENVRAENAGKFRRVRSDRSKLETAALDGMYHSDDPYSRVFSILFRGGYRDEYLEPLTQIESLTGTGSEIDYYRMCVDQERAKQAQRAKIAEGKQFIDFTATTADGTEIKLSEVVAGHRYTLLEFWASWCAPCRAEIPHMKDAYGEFKDRGFGIFSFSIDSSREAWLKAEQDESLPWVSTSATDPDIVVALYAIESIPSNFLIDADGKIVARNLRGKRLSDFLESRIALTSF